jgi:GAF domain-containing protein
MVPRSESVASGLTGVLHGLAAEFRRTSGAEMVTLVLYDADDERYYAPFALGQPEESLLDSLTDMQAQLGRYLADAAQRKAPDDLAVQQYGSTVWLTVGRRTLVARDAPSEIDSTFVRRHHVESTVGLPLLAGDDLVGLVYLNYRSQDRAPDAERIGALERQAAGAAREVRAALAQDERAALEGAGRLTALLTEAAEDGGADRGSLRRRLSIALAELLLASHLDAAVVYDVTGDRHGVELVTAHAPAAAPPRLALADDPARREPELTADVASAMAEAELHPTGTHALGKPDEPTGYLVLLSRDPLAAVRRARATDLLLRAAADLIGGALASRDRIATLARGNRLLGALARMSSAMLRPGSSRQEVLDAVAAHLTDAAVPEFDFHFATVYLLDDGPDAAPMVRMSAGASASDAIASTVVAGGHGGRPTPVRVPRWAMDQERALDPGDVVAFVARAWQVVLVGPTSRGAAASNGDLFAGSLPEDARWLQVPVVRDGAVVQAVPACLIGEPENLAAAATEGPPFTLAGDIFEAGGHADLIRLFLPVGLDTGSRATGVLEVGYHRSSSRRPDWGQVEALRAAAAQVAIAVETARLYEDARRHGEQLELSADVSRAIASSIDLDQTLRLVARNLVRLVDASTCQIALYEEDGEGWFGAAASDQEELWRRQRGERPDGSFLFDVLDRGQAVVIEDTGAGELAGSAYVRTFGVRALLALPLEAGGQTIGAAVLAQRDQPRTFTVEEVHRAQGLAHQAAVAIKNARLHALTEEERHIQKDFVLVGFGQWGQRAYRHLQVLKQFFNFRLHVVDHDDGEGARERLAGHEAEVLANGDAFYWDVPASPADQQLRRELEPSCYAITYIATPAATHLATLARYYDLSDVVLIEKPLGAPPDEYRRFLDGVAGGVELVAADHYYFKLEVRLLQQLLTEERTLRAFLDSVQEVRIEILEAQPLAGAAADIGVVADLLPHAFAIISLLTPIDRLQLDEEAPLVVGRHEPAESERETYARLTATFPYQGRPVRLVVDVGKGVEDAKWIRLSGERRAAGRSPFYKFDFAKGEAIDGTQSTVRAAVRKIREPGVPDNAHLTMLRHVIEKRHPAVGILSIREAIRANQRTRELEALAAELVARAEFTRYPPGARPAFAPR